MINPSLEIGIVGAGGWGTALSLLLAGKGHRVDLWVFEEDLCATMQQDRENPVYLPGFRLPEGIRPSNSLQEVVAGKKVLLLVVPTHVLRNTLKALKRFLDPDCLVINASKGIENETLLPIHKSFRNRFPILWPLCRGRPSPRKSHRANLRRLLRRPLNRKPPNGCSLFSIRKN